MRLRIIPQDAKFFDMFERDADNLLRGTKQLRNLIDDYTDIEAKVDVLTEREAEGDTITHDIIEELNRSFVTPFDREDIYALASALDDVMDRMQAAADVMLVYKLPEPNDAVRGLVDIISKSVEEIVKAMPLLRHRDEMPKILGHCIEVNRLENEGDKLHRRALIELFACPHEALEVIIWREVYEQLESATDACEDVADVLRGMVMKHA